MKRGAAINQWARGYIPGDNWMMCDHCGMRFRASQMRQQPHGIWKGLWVCPQDYDDYNPQHEDLRAVPERIVPDKTNPEPEGTTIGTNVGGFPFTFPFALGGYDGSQKITGDDL